MINGQIFENGTAKFQVKNNTIPDLVTSQSDGLMSPGDKYRLNRLAEASHSFLIDTIPHQVNSLTYDGTELSPVLSSYNVNKIVVSGTTSATNVGTYTINLDPAPGYEWDESVHAGGGTDTIALQWTIAPAVLEYIPSQMGTLTYNAITQSPVWDNLVSGSVTITGNTSAVNAGTYTATFTPNNNYIWSDTTRDPKSATWTIGKFNVTIPSISDTSKTYNGSSQSPTIPSVNSDIITVSGNTSATTVGNYVVTFSLNDTDNYQWADGTTTNIDNNWSIGKASVTKPSISDTSKTYNGGVQGPTLPSIDTNIISQTGNSNATNAGDYTVTYSLIDTDNYEWSDGSTSAVDCAWSIAQATPTFSVSKSSISLSASSMSDTFTVTYTGDGTVSVSSTNTSYATCSKSGNTVTVTAVASGSCNITVSVSGNVNYTSVSSKSVSVSVSLMPEIGNALNTYTWSQIKQISEAGQGSNYFSVGDRKSITLNGTIGSRLTLSNKTLYIYILDFNHTEGSKGNLNGNHIVFGGFKSALSGGTDLCLCDWSDSRKTYGGYHGDGTVGNNAIVFSMNHHNSAYQNYGGWKGCDLRYDILGATSTQPSGYRNKTSSNVGYDATSITISSPKSNTFMAALPSDLRAVLKLRTHWADNTGGGSSNAASSSVIDACFLLSEKEVFGSNSYQGSTDAGYDTQFAYYTNGNSKVKYNHQATSKAVYWWESSPNYSTASYFCGVNLNGGADISGAYGASGVAPGFIV